MKRKTIALLIVLVMVFLCAGSVFADENNAAAGQVPEEESTSFNTEEENAGLLYVTAAEETCEHDMTAVEAVDPTCESDGNSAYWACSVCGKYFEDSEGENEIEADSWVIPAHGHSYENGICIYCMKEEPEYVPVTGFVLEGGIYRYYVNDEFMADYTGIIKTPIDGINAWYYVSNGVYDDTATGLAQKADGSSKNWYYVSNGKYVSTAKGLARKADGSSKSWYYVSNGKYVSTATGLAKKADGSDSNWYYVLNGKYTKNTGITQKADGTSTKWFYVSDGKYVSTAAGLAKKADGSSTKLYYVLNGKYTKNTGLARKADGSDSTWYYVLNGKFVSGIETVCSKADGSSDKLYYVKKSIYTKATLTFVIDGVKYAVTKGKAVKSDWIIVLDPGHDLYHIGGTYNGISETEVNWSIAQYLKAELDKYDGVQVLINRESLDCAWTGAGYDTGSCLKYRCEYAKNVNADFLISVHNDWSSNSETTGCLMLCQNKNYRSDLHEQSEGMANAITAELTKLGLYYRGIWELNIDDGRTYPDGSIADYYGILRYSKLYGVPAVIVEHCCYSNKSDVSKYLSSEKKLKKLGVADATGIANYLGLSLK